MTALFRKQVPDRTVCKHLTLLFTDLDWSSYNSLILG